MPTKEPTPTPPNPIVILNSLVEIANQVEASQDVDKDTFNKAKALNSMAENLTKEWGDKLTGLGAVDEDLNNVATALQAWAALLAPQAGEQWDATTVSQQLTYLEAIQGLGMLTEDQVTTLQSVKETLKAARKGGGVRAQRQPQDRIAGRPQFVISTYQADGETKRLGTNAGNLPNSTSNIKTAAVRFINKALDGKTMTTEQVDEIHAAIKVAVEEGKITEVFGITFTPSEVAS